MCVEGGEFLYQICLTHTKCVPYHFAKKKKMAFCAKVAEGTWPKTLSHFKEIEILAENIPTCDLNTYSRAEPKSRQTTRS